MAHDQNSSDECYSTLREAVLNRLFVGAVGLRTTTELTTEICAKTCEHNLRRMDIPNHIIKYMLDNLKLLCDTYVKNVIFETNFESYFDAQPPFQLDKAILTGSFSEGLFLYCVKAPDMDFMCVLKNITFSRDDQEDGNLLLREDTPFVHAFVTKTEIQRLWSEYFDEADAHVKKRRLSSRKLKEKLAKKYKEAGKLFPSLRREVVEEIGEGAAITTRNPKSSLQEISKLIVKRLRQQWNAGEELVSINEIVHAILVSGSDIVLSISCEGWPKSAREWITRERVWPDARAVEKIAQSGFHLVPKSSPDGNFRLSFSCAETMLIETLSPLQHKVLLAFKFVFKYHQNNWNSSSNCKGTNTMISSYHLKTIALWYFEKTPPEVWTEEFIVHHLVTLLEELQNALKHHNLPMYFMPKVNLFRKIEEPEFAIDLIENISKLSRNFSAMSEAIYPSKRSTSFPGS
jgi:hypothetical protein